MYSNILKSAGAVMTLSKSVECTLDPISLMQALSQESNSDNRMLLESCEIDNKQQLKSILINKAALRIECNQQQVSVTSLTSNGNNALDYLAEKFNVTKTTNNENRNQIIITYLSPLEVTLHQQLDEETRLKQISPIDCLRKINQAFQSQNNHPYAVFLSGLFSFDFIASFENLPDVPYGKNDCPDYVFYLAEEVIVFDHQTLRSNIYSNIFSGSDSERNYFEQSRRIEKISKIMLTSNNSSPETNILNHKKSITQENTPEFDCDISDQDYEAIVVKLKQDIVVGNVFQVVPSRTFSLACKDELLSYQQLKKSNPSPYMFYMHDQNFILFGASPESALKYQKDTNKVELYPIAGTRARGKNNQGQIDHDLDKRFEAELKLDGKEISEHMMLVDLARNDVARISDAGSIQIPRLLEVDRYSQVMHLVSCVQGDLRKELDCFHAYQACMNMGTLTGAPKIKASELIRTTEKKRRGSYGGAVGYINTDGDMDTCIVIRSAFCKNGIAHIQAGAGIVYDSDPTSESEETRKKANAVIFAIQAANKIQIHEVNNEQ